MSDVVNTDKPFDGHSNPDLAKAIPIITLINDLTGHKVPDNIIGIAGQLLGNPTTGGIISSFFAFIGNLIHHHAAMMAPAPGTQQVAVVAPLAPVVPVTPVATAPAAVGAFNIATLKGKMYFVELPERLNNGHRGALEERDRFVEILGGDNIHSGSRIHTDFSPFDTNGGEIGTGDPRWLSANRWAPNGCPIWLYYEWNGQSTLDGHHSENVEPGSVEDDEGCTPVYLVTGPGKIRFGAMYRDFDGRIVDSGYIGQGNVPGGEPFNVAEG